VSSDQYDLILALNEVAVRLGWRPTQADTSSKKATVTYLTEKEYAKWHFKPKPRQEQEPGVGA